MKVFWSFLIFSLASCTTSPLGRRQLTLMPDNKMNAMGAESFQEMKQKMPIERDGRINSYVRCVANAIVAQSTDETGVSNWETVVFKEDSANAFALPGGKIGVHTGLLKVTTNADQLAAVLGHEVGHVIARHGNERVSQSVLAQTGLAAADLTLKDKENKSLIMAGLGLGAQFGVLMPWGRKQESEADLIGLKLMAKAGFDPRQSVELWKNMSRAGGSGPPEFLSTHPSHSTRIQDLNKNMAEPFFVFQSQKSKGVNPQCAR